MAADDIRTQIETLDRTLSSIEAVLDLPKLRREIAMLGGDVSKFVFPSVDRWLQKKIATLAAPAPKA